MGELPGRRTRGCDFADHDLSVRFDAGENGGNSEGRVQDSAAGVLTNVQRGGNIGVLPWLHRYDPRCYSIRRLQLLHVRLAEKLTDW